MNLMSRTVVSIKPPVGKLRRREQKQGVVKVNTGARLVMERASCCSLGRQIPARRKSLIPSTSLRGDSKGSSLACHLELIQH
jgi:hypothetical protein